ncbi:hypothetical protein AADG42_01690 [Ammonicoccus fulvus]|uniref:Uncharacterized protein n=1 Tax=Ammonicoccus fulvus TaxID=3138240 RepID=A0ABZ3FL10_9ACTN
MTTVLAANAAPQALAAHFDATVLPAPAATFAEARAALTGPAPEVYLGGLVDRADVSLLELDETAWNALRAELKERAAEVSAVASVMQDAGRGRLLLFLPADTFVSPSASRAMLGGLTLSLANVVNLGSEGGVVAAAPIAVSATEPPADSALIALAAHLSACDPGEILGRVFEIAGSEIRVRRIPLEIANPNMVVRLRGDESDARTVAAVLGAN